MYSSKFPFSMENLPRQRSVGCLTLKLASVIVALTVMLYSILALSLCIATLTAPPGSYPDHLQLDDSAFTCVLVGTVIIAHIISFCLSALMLLGALRDKAGLLKPWVVWTSLQLIAGVLLFVLWSTMNVITQFDDNALLLYMMEFLGLVVRFYMLTVVGSFCKQLEEEQGETERLRTVDLDSWYTEA